MQVKSHRTQPILYGTVIQFLLYGQYKGDVFATGGQVEIALVSRELMTKCGDSMPPNPTLISVPPSLYVVVSSLHAFNMTLFPRSPEGFTTRPRPFSFPRLTRPLLMKPSKVTSRMTLPSERAARLTFPDVSRPFFSSQCSYLFADFQINSKWTGHRGTRCHKMLFVQLGL